MSRRTDELEAPVTAAIEGGTFVMGTRDDTVPEDEVWADDLDDMEIGAAGNARYAVADRQAEKPARELVISALECMVFPVTRGLYLAIMDHDPGWPERDPGHTALDAEIARLPVNNVTWYDAIAFCNRLSERQGLTPCYRFDVGPENGPENERSEQHDPSSSATEPRVPLWRREAEGYRLPTEAEWEYLCRAGVQSQWSFGDDRRALGDHAWFRDNADGRPQPVGGKKPNAWGLHDMHGNVSEWCWDWYAPYPGRESGSSGVGAERDPDGPPDGSAPVLDLFDGHAEWVRSGARSIRGGAFYFAARDLRSASREYHHPTFRYKDIGFRCVRGVHRSRNPRTVR